MAKPDFLLEATHCLCSSLQVEESLGRFYSFLKLNLPLNELHIATAPVPCKVILRLAEITDISVDCVPRLIALTEVQQKQAEIINARNHEIYGERHILNDDDTFLLYLQMSPNHRKRAPMFFLRLIQENKIMGSCSFLARRPFTEDELDLLRSLHSALCIAVTNLVQFWELSQLKEQLMQENERLRRKINELPETDVIGYRGGLREVMKRVSMVAPIDVPALITGETGTGKDVIARALHSMSPRKEKTLVAVNCGAIPSSLIDSELFGYVKGAFTGANANHKGRFERADGGTLFLDEVAELPLEAQVRLLRVLESHEVERVGSSAAIPVDVRIVAATHRNLPQMVADGKFREDLYYRLHVVSIRLPPLRERKQDIPELAHFLLQRSASRYGLLSPGIAIEEMERLMRYDWPGNVRELQNVLEEALVCSNGLPLCFASSLPVPARKEADPARVQNPDHSENFIPNAPSAPLPNMTEAMGIYLAQCLRATNGKVAGPYGAAHIAGLNPSTFRFRCKQSGLDIGSFS